MFKHQSTTVGYKKSKAFGLCGFVATASVFLFVSTEKDREGNRIHWYRKISQPTTTEEPTEETTEEPTTTTTPEEPKQKELPNTGVATTAITTGLATLFAGLGLAVSKKKK